MENLFSLAGKRFLITGGTRGIGRAISLRFAHAGASVIANYVRDVKSAEKLKSETDKEGLSLDICRADLTSQKGFERLLESIKSDERKLSGMVHCAATGVHGKIEELTCPPF